MLQRWFAFLMLCFTALVAAAQGFPDRPIRIVVPLPPGGSPDTIARVLSQGLQAIWSQPIVVENRTGGSQNIGAEAVAKSPPDGYTWFLSPDNVFSINPHVSKQSFDPFAHLAPVTLLARIEFLLVVHPSVPANSVSELVAYAKSHPRELNYGSSGNSGTQHLATALLEQLTGVSMNHVPYKGAAPAVADLVPGRIQVWIGAANSLLPHIKAGKLRLLAVASSQRWAMLPDVPTIDEAVPGYGAVQPWLGLFVPSKTPPDVIQKINGEVRKLLEAPETKAKFAAQGIEVWTSSPQEFARFLREDNARWGKVIREAGIKGE